MKPSERIHRLIENAFGDIEWQERAIQAIIKYLDEDYDKACKEATNEFYKIYKWK